MPADFKRFFHVENVKSLCTSSSTTGTCTDTQEYTAIAAAQQLYWARLTQKSQCAFIEAQSPALALASAQATRPRNTKYSMPHGFEQLLHHEPESSSPPPPRRKPTLSRYHLHVRQQPLASRACGASDWNRRPVDPPPIVQILLSDFGHQSKDDRDILQDPRFTVGCLLFLVSDSFNELHSQDKQGPEREKERDSVTRADEVLPTPLLGKVFMSPFYVDVDPDPISAPTHPSSHTQSPSLALDPDNNHQASKLHQPATFFIFTDLSIRSAGTYRLQFRLMNWGSVEDTGQSMPILAEAWSDLFRVYPAKDFPGMRDSSVLAERLKELGFAELNIRGKGKGKGRKKY